MTERTFGSFCDVVSDVLANVDTDPIRHMLVLTYEYDEQQLLNLLCKRELQDWFEPRRKHRLWLADLRPVVIYDARKTRETTKIPQFVELHPYKTAGFTCHHSKGYLLITDHCVHLVLGSFNLTQKGLFQNREVFETYTWSEQQTADLGLLAQWTAFLEDNYLPRVRESAASALGRIVHTLRQRVVRLEEVAGSVNTQRRLILSGYEPLTERAPARAGIDTLVALWKEWYPAVEPNAIFAVSPFFDENCDKGSLAHQLHSRFASLKRMTLVTDADVAPMLSRSHYGGIERCSLRTIPHEIGDRERDRIEEYATTHGTSTRNLTLHRALHAKIMVLSNGNHGLVYMGSANFSKKAWLGGNRECGLAWRINDAENFCRLVTNALSCDNKDRYAELPAEPSPGEPITDPEEYEEEIARSYPDFLEYVVLEPADNSGRLRFRFECSPRAANEGRTLADYRIEWSGLMLRVDDNLSQHLEIEEFRRRLASGRNLQFTLVREPERVHFVPFQYSEAVVAERKRLVHGSSWDWLRHYLNPDRGDPPGEHERAPGLPSEGEWDHGNDAIAVGREANPVIAMQAYLNLFSRIEADFAERLVSLTEDNERDTKASLESSIVEPLRVLHALLTHEAGSGTGQQCAEVRPHDVFKVGELLLFVAALRAKAGRTAGAPLRELADSLADTLRAWPTSDAPQQAYVTFVTKEAGV